MSPVDTASIESVVYEIRGQRVMLDSDLAKLYGVENKHLKRQVQRNLERFPSDFMFSLSNQELAILKRQIGASRLQHGGNRKSHYAFTENGVAMLAGILHSPTAIEVNISIMRIFTRLRSFLLLENRLEVKIDSFQKDNIETFKEVFERLDGHDAEILKQRELLTPVIPRKRKKIGLKE
jgi:hypothetical protein